MIIDGRALAEEFEFGLKEVFSRSRKKVSFVLFGDSPASRQFIGIKTRVAKRLGIETVLYEYDADTTTEEALRIVKEVSETDTHGIIVQLPLPSHIDTQKLLDAIPVRLDIDVLSSLAKEQFKNGTNDAAPPVARAVYEILHSNQVELVGTKIVIVGKGRLVGEPVALLFDRMRVSYEMIEKETEEELKEKLLKEADVIISGAGSPHFLKPDMIKDGVVLIDAGTSELSGMLVGDIDPRCYEKASLVTPVPGGIGPLTVVSLFQNLL